MSPSMQDDPRDSRPYAIVLFGASGFTGKLVAEDLAELRQPRLSWALAGRNRSKLEAVRAELTSIDAGLASLPILVADSNDQAALVQVAKQARVVCTTVGPYAHYGHGLAAACAEHGTDYCDLAGEF